MIIAMIAVLVLLTALSYFPWNYIHEMSHVLMAKLRVGVAKYELKLLPYKDPVYGWRFGSCKYWLLEEPTEKDQAFISLAPRIPDALAVIMFALTGLFSGWLAVVWAAFWGAGLIDLGVGSMGISEHSDLRKAAKSAGYTPWLYRIFGWSAIATSVGAAAIMFFGG